MNKIIPARYLRIAKQKKTVGTRNPRTGMMTGRVVTTGKGDSTRSQYLVKDYDIDKDGKIEKNERAGTIQGRTVVVKSTKRARGYERRV
jgi:hypothetical protein